MKVLLSTIPSLCYATFLMITGVTSSPVIIMNIALLNIVCPFLLKGRSFDNSNIHKEILSSFVFLLFALANVVFPHALALGYGFAAAKTGLTANSVMYLALMLISVVDTLIKNCVSVKYSPRPTSHHFSRQDPIDPAQLGLMNSAEKIGGKDNQSETYNQDQEPIEIAQLRILDTAEKIGEIDIRGDISDITEDPDQKAELDQREDQLNIREQELRRREQILVLRENEIARETGLSNNISDDDGTISINSQDVISRDSSSDSTYSLDKQNDRMTEESRYNENTDPNTTNLSLTY